MPKVSVIIPTYNCARYLPEAIDSVLNQAYRDFEVIIIDDGSTDNTKEVVDAYINSQTRKLANSQTYIKYFYQENKGHSIARNVGIKNAGGEYIALLDADDVWLTERLEKGLQLMEKDKQIGLVHSDVIGIDDKGIPIKKVALNAKQKEKKIKFLSGKIFLYLLTRKIHICCATVMIRRKCIDDVGLFDEKLSRLGCEDRDLWLRISEKYEVGYIDKPLAYYRHRMDSMSKNTDKMLKARYYVLEKIFSQRSLSLILRRQAYSSIHHELAYGYLLNKEYDAAKKECLRAIFYFPLDAKPYKIFIKTYLTSNNG